MSDERQPGMPKGLSPRAELVLYVSEPKRWMIDVLKGLAEHPFESGCFLYHGHTVPNGMPMTEEPSKLTNFFFMTRPFESPEFLKFRIEGDVVAFLTLIPMTDEEHQFAIAQGSDALADRFAEVGFDPVVDEQRDSVV